MKEVTISEFKANCSALLERVGKSKKPIRITRRGKPLAEIVPLSPAAQSRAEWLGCMKGKMRIVGDIVSPVIDLDDLEALRTRRRQR